MAVGQFDMEKQIYVVKRIEGEYAYLENKDGEELFIAMALLPEGVDEGMTLEYDFPNFSILF